MGRKKQTRSQAFQAAKQNRNDILDSLKTCQTADKVEALAERYQKLLKSDEPKTRHKKTSSHLKQIQNLDSQITQCIEEKRKQFAPKPIIEPSVITPDASLQLITPDANLQLSLVPYTESQLLDDEDKPTEIIKVKDPQREAQLANVKKQLDIFLDKKTEFIGIFRDIMEKNPVNAEKLFNYAKAHNAIASIHQNITKLYEQYIHNEINLEHFKTQAEPYLKKENENVQILQAHRGVKQILVNLLAAILGVGVIYGLAAWAKGEFLIFNPPTDSAEKLSNIKDSIEMVTASPAV